MTKLSNLGVKPPKRRTEPLWAGPSGEGPLGGITYSMLSRFIGCRERFRLYAIEGLRTREEFNSKIEYGQMWHVCEEALAGSANKNCQGIIDQALLVYCKSLIAKYPLSQEQIDHWYKMCKEFFPLYVKHWSEHPDVKDRTPLFQEQTFDVPYKLPSGRVVRLRGKWDSVDLIGNAKKSLMYLQENKTKSAIDVVKLQRQMKFDLQTMLYCVSLTQGMEQKLVDPYPFGGVRYNVIKRSAHKSTESALKKFEDDSKASRLNEWFARLKVEISPADVLKFRHECLDSLLEQLLDWYGWVTCPNDRNDVFDGGKGIHWRHPYGLWSVVDETGWSDVDNFIETGSEVGLKRVETLFTELQP